MFLRISADLNFKTILKFRVCYYLMTISWFPVKVIFSSLLIHRRNPRHDTLDSTESKKSKYCFIIKYSFDGSFVKSKKGLFILRISHSYIY